jgi:hypothetical protein
MLMVFAMVKMNSLALSEKVPSHVTSKFSAFSLNGIAQLYPEPKL